MKDLDHPLNNLQSQLCSVVGMLVWVRCLITIVVVLRICMHVLFVSGCSSCVIALAGVIIFIGTGFIVVVCFSFFCTLYCLSWCRKHRFWEFEIFRISGFCVSMSDIANDNEDHHPTIESVHPTTETDSPDETVRHIHFCYHFFLYYS